MTREQFYWLKWLDSSGGRGRLEGCRLKASNGKLSNPRAAVTFLHLAALGAIAGEQGELSITEYGRRHLEHTETPRLL